MINPSLHALPASGKGHEASRDHRKPLQVGAMLAHVQCYRRDKASKGGSFQWGFGFGHSFWDSPA